MRWGIGIRLCSRGKILQGVWFCTRRKNSFRWVTKGEKQGPSKCQSEKSRKFRNSIKRNGKHMIRQKDGPESQVGKKK